LLLQAVPASAPLDNRGFSMDFMTAVRTCLSKYVDFSGRARRSEYWYFALFSFLVSLAASIVDAVIGTDYDGATSGGLIQTVVGLAFFLPSLAVAVRRLHDTDRSGWWILIGLIPLVGFIVLIVFWATQGNPGANQYGAPPPNEPAVA